MKNAWRLSALALFICVTLTTKASYGSPLDNSKGSTYDMEWDEYRHRNNDTTYSKGIEYLLIILICVARFKRYLINSNIICMIFMSICSRSSKPHR